VLTVSPKGVTTKSTPKWIGTLVGIRFEVKGGISIAELFKEYAQPEADEQMQLFEQLFELEGPQPERSQADARQ